MSIDSLRKNLLAYAVGALISIVIGVFGEIHRQIVGGGSFDYWLWLDAAILVVSPVLANMLINMKFPSVGHEPLADKASDHEDALRLAEPKEKPPRKPRRKAVLTEPVVAMPDPPKGLRG